MDTLCFGIKKFTGHWRYRHVLYKRRSPLDYCDCGKYESLIEWRSAKQILTAPTGATPTLISFLIFTIPSLNPKPQNQRYLVVMTNNPSELRFVELHNR